MGTEGKQSPSLSLPHPNAEGNGSRNRYRFAGRRVHPITADTDSFVGKDPQYCRDKGWQGGCVGALCLSSWLAQRGGQDRHQAPPLVPSTPCLYSSENHSPQQTYPCTPLHCPW